VDIIYEVSIQFGVEMTTGVYGRVFKLVSCELYRVRSARLRGVIRT
jgi:hypothetical protein